MSSQVNLGSTVRVVYENTYAGFGTCRYCNKTIHWSATSKGVRIAVDATNDGDVFTPHNIACAGWRAKDAARSVTQ